MGTADNWVNVAIRDSEKHRASNWGVAPEVYWLPPLEGKGAGSDKMELAFSLA